MNQATLIEALKSHIGALQEITTWTLLVALAVAWAGINNKPKITIGSFDLDRNNAFRAAAALYLAANVAFLLLLLRIESLLGLIIDPQLFISAYTTLATHEWLLNPFAFFGTSRAAALGAPWGIAALIVGWWLCLGSVFAIKGLERRTGGTYLVLFLFYVCGLVSLYEFSRIYDLNLERLQHTEVLAAIRETAFQRWAAIWVSVAVGLAAFWLLWPKAEKPQKRPAKAKA